MSGSVFGAESNSNHPTNFSYSSGSKSKCSQMSDIDLSFLPSRLCFQHHHHNTCFDMSARILPLSRTALRAAPATRSVVRKLSTSAAACAISKFTMPAMSPTMTAGGIATWKVKEGQAFSAGDVLLEIETDKATMDVEAQDDGVLAKIVVQDGAKDVNVGKIIAMLAEEGDDISSVEVPQEDASPSTSSSADEQPKSSDKESKTTPSETSSKSNPQSSSQTGASTGAAAPSSPGSSTSNAGTHASFKGPLFPSVQRLIAENHIEEAESKIKGTGIRGMITKGDVLAFLGQAKSPTGTFKEPQGGIAVLGPKQANPKGSAGGGAASSEVSSTLLQQCNNVRPLTTSASTQPLSGDALRSLILAGLAASSKYPRQPAPAVVPAPRTAPFALHTVDSAAEDQPKVPSLSSSGAVRKDGIRADDPLWDLI